MSDKRLQEDRILEKLNQQTDIHSLLTVAIKLINKSVNRLILNIFCKEPHAIKFVIPSLVGKNGPLNDTSVCLKLLFALGILSRADYEDIELLIAILDELDLSDKHYHYSDDEILGPISLLHDMVLPQNWVLQQDQVAELGIVDNFKSSILQNRYQQMIRSALIIAITDLILRISNKPKHKDHD